MTRRHLMPAAGLIAVAMTLAISSPAPAQPKTGGAEPDLLGTYGDWGAYIANAGGRKVCFALAKPSSSQLSRQGWDRGATYMFVSTRPAENVRNEVSIIFGYAFKPNADATVEIGSS